MRNAQPQVMRLATRSLSSALVALVASCVYAEVPTVRTISPIGLQRGSTVEVEITGEELKTAHQILFFSRGLEAKNVTPLDNKKLKFELTASEDAECDLHAFRVITARGISNLRLLSVSPFESDSEKEPNNDFGDPQLIAMNRTINGSIQPEDVDHFVVEVPQGEMISVEVEGLRHNYLNNMFDPFVAIYDEQGKELASSDDATLVQQDCVCGVIAPAAGRYIIELRDSSYGGGRDSVYRIHVGNYARPIAIYPSGGRPGETLVATCVDSIGNTWEESFKLPDEPHPKFKVWSKRGKVQAPSPNYLRVSTAAVVLETEPNDKAEKLTAIENFPAAFHGCLQSIEDRDHFAFIAKKDQTLEFKLVARTITRSPVDGVVEIYDEKGRRLALGDDSPAYFGSVSPDGQVSFKAPADGTYYALVRNHLPRGGAQYTYRLEVDPPAPKLTTTIRELERYMSQTIAVPRGRRMAVDVLLDRKSISGDAELIIPDLPPGMEQVKAVVSEKTNHVQLMLKASADAPLAGALVDLSAKTKIDKGNAEVIGHMDQRTQIVRGQNNRDVWGINSDKLAVAVVDNPGFDIEVVAPKVPLVRDGTLPLVIKVKREPEFNRSIRLKMLDPPSGVTASTSISIPSDKSEVEFPLTANSKAALGKFPVTILATAVIDSNTTVTLASEFVDVEVADRLFDFQFNKTMAEVGKPAKISIGVNLLRPVDGQVEVEMVGLPPGTTMEKTKLPLAKDANRLTYTLSIPATVRPGVFKTIACRGTVSSDAGVITQVNGTAEVQIDVPRGKGSAKAATDNDKALTRLEQLRQQRAAQPE